MNKEKRVQLSIYFAPYNGSIFHHAALLVVAIVSAMTPSRALPDEKWDSF